MGNLSYIDTGRSIETGRLVYKRSWLERLDTIVFSMLCFALVTCPTLLFFQVNINNPNEMALAFTVMPLAILVGFYGLYRKLTETKLTCVETNFKRYRNKEVLMDFIKQNGYKVFRESKEVIIVVSEESLSFNNLWTKTITFIVSDRKLLFNIVKNYPKLNPPVLFTHLFLKADLKNFFNSRQNKSKAPLRDKQSNFR